ncbi:MAG: DUF3795 domain-containing protein [Methanocorpusculum sp.]|nr:DUF3795 domain-containing protein [Methanocorpusculum sp.]
MKDFARQNQLLSLCGLNCGLCPMNLGKYCPGCGGGEGNHSCAVARCGIEHNNPEYCFECGNYPCNKYEHIDDYDSFITHQRQKADLKKAKKGGIENYNNCQREKVEILKTLLSEYNDGRRKTFFCLAVNLLELSDIKSALIRIEEKDMDGFTLKEKSEFAVSVFNETAEKKNIRLKLIKKK